MNFPADSVKFSVLVMPPGAKKCPKITLSIKMATSPTAPKFPNCSPLPEASPYAQELENCSAPPKESEEKRGLSRRQRKNCRKKENKPNYSVSLKGSKPPCKTYEELGMSDQQIYYWIYSYCLDLIRLRRLGFPLDSELHPGSSVVYVDPDIIPGFDDEECVTSTSILDANAEEFIPSSSREEEGGLNVCAKEFIPSSSGSNDECPVRELRTCTRCKRMYHVHAREKCRYHWGKQRAPFDAYTCCKSLGQGCCTAKGHVWRGKLFETPGMHGPFKNFVRTKGRKDSPRVYALDGEMCYTTQGMELIRLSVVSIDGRPVYDTLVRPENPVIDYNTRFSGITDRDLKNNPRVKTLRNVQNDLMGFISASTILVGHGLENDLRALRLIHNLVVDTSVLYPHYYGLPYRRSLKSLARSYLKQEIQSETGHDSFEDARASLELVLCKVKAEVASTVINSNRTATLPTIFMSYHHPRPPGNNELITNSKLRLKLEEDIDPNFWQQ